MPTPPRIPAPLWSFGRRGWIAVTLAAVIVIARGGFDPFAATLGTLVPLYSHGPVMSVVTAIYAGFDVVFDWIDLGSPEIQSNLWIAASYAIALTIPDLRRRWIPIGLITLTGILWLAVPYIEPLGVSKWFYDSWRSGRGILSVLNYLALGLFVQLLLAAPWLRSPRLLVALAAMILAAALWRHGMSIEAQRLGTPEHSYAVGNWLWFAVWYTLLLVWAFRERRRRTPIDPARCLGCGYDLKGLRAATCPECGTEFIRTEDASTDRPPA